MSKNKLRGRVWRFGDDINTDSISPAEYMDQSYEVIGGHAMERAMPGFAQAISPGDFIVAGSNFGSGSSRETAQIALKYAGVGAVVAQSFARIFFRNCINVGVPVLTLADTAPLNQGDEIEIDLLEGVIKNRTTGQTLQGSKLPEHVLAIVRCGGLKEYLKSYIHQ